MSLEVYDCCHMRSVVWSLKGGGAENRRRVKDVEEANRVVIASAVTPREY